MNIDEFLKTVAEEESYNRIAPFFVSFLGTALWAETHTPDPENDSDTCSLDEDFDIDDFSQEALEEVWIDCAHFLLDPENDPTTTYLATLTYQELKRAGYDFLLTRNGHGAGFWDGDWGTKGDELTERSKAYGGVDFYPGDDGLLYC